MIGILIFPDFQILDAAGPVSVFEIAGRFAGHAAPAIRVLVRATKGGRAPIRILGGLMLNDESAVPNKQVQDILAGKAALPLAVP